MSGLAKISRYQLASVIAAQTDQQKSWGKLSRQVAAYLIAAHREDELPMIMRDVMQLRLDKGIVEAILECARQPSPEVVSQVKKRLKVSYPEAKQILIHIKLDPLMIGGIRIVMPQSELDASLLKKLVDFKRLTLETR